MTHDGLPETSRLAGVVTTAELERAGITDARIRVLVRRGVLTSLGRGVYARTELAGQIGDRTPRLAAARAIAGPRAVASHCDAALIHGLALLDRPSASILSVSHRRGLPGGRGRRPAIRLHLVSLPPDQVTTANGEPVTTVARTVVDLARTTPFRAGVVAADSALYRRKTSKSDLRSVIAASRRWPGIERARQVVDFSDARSESPFESISRVAFRDGGLPPPELQVWVGGQDGPVGRVDFLRREHRTIAKADGALKYEDPDRARRQLRRDADLRAAGFEVVHFSWANLTLTSGQVIRAIRAAFGRAAALRAAECPAGRAG